MKKYPPPGATRTRSSGGTLVATLMLRNLSNAKRCAITIAVFLNGDTSHHKAKL